VARVSKFSLSQLKAEASQVSLLLCLCLCLPLTRPLWAQEVGQEAGHEVLPAVATGEAITDPTTTPTREVAASPLLPSAMATVAAAGSKAQEIAQTALGMLGIRYKFGGNLPEQGFDCSGLVRYVFKQVLGVELPRTAKSMSAEGVPVLLADLQVGDLVFFNTRKFAFSHVGIYLGEQRFVHAPNRRGTVNIEEIDLKYWRSRFNGARRLVNQQQ
jgi:cell wall-associated NlpC family hydrolase